MPRIIPLSEVSQMVDKEVIAGTKGKITKLYKQKSGSSNGKDWSVQDCSISDGTAEVKVKIWNHPELPQTAKGKELTLTAHSGSKGLSGVYAHEDDYDGKVTLQIKVTDTGVVEVAGMAQSQEHPDPDPEGTARDNQRQQQDFRREQQRARTPAPKQEPLTDEQAAKENASTVRRKQIQIANLLAKNLDSAAWIASKFNLKHKEFSPMTTEDVRALGISMQIQCERLNMVELMPTTALPDDAPKGGAK